MITRLILIAGLWLGSILSFDLDYQQLYPQFLELVRPIQGEIIAYSIGGAILVVLCSFLLVQFQVFGPLYLLARLSFEISQFTIYLLSFAAVVFWFDFGRHLWLDMGALALVPFLALSASCLSLWIFDFNYPLRNRIQRNLALPALSLLIVTLAANFDFPL